MAYITDYQYYENNQNIPTDENWGSYQYVTLENIVNNFMLMYQGNNEIINEHTIIPKEINNSNTNIAEEEEEERDQLEELEAELYSLKMQLRVK